MHSVKSAAAKSLRGAAAMCVPEGHSSFDEAAFEIFTTGGSFYADDDGTESNLICAFPEFDTFVRAEATTLNVYVYDNNDAKEIAAMACTSSFSSAAGSCGTLIHSGVGSVPGWTTLEVPIDGASGTWDDTATGAAYISVGTTGGPSVIFDGYFISD